MNNYQQKYISAPIKGAFLFYIVDKMGKSSKNKQNLKTGTVDKKRTFCRNKN